MATQDPNMQSIKVGFAVASVFLLLIGGIGAMLSGGLWVDFAVTDARQAQACLTAWDSRFEPRYEGSQCSILQRGYRIPIGDFVSPNSVYSPGERDY